jgi:hypothetical protein
MKPYFAIGVVALALLSAASASEARPSCHLPGGRALATNSIARLISVPTPDGAALFACIRRTGRKVALDDGYSDATLAGRWVAWQRPGTPGHWRIDVHDLQTGKERLVDGHVASHSLHLTRRGSIVWAQALDSGGGTPLYANELKSGGRLLDSGNVDATSIVLRGRRVSWFTDDIEHSALVY